MRKKTTMGSMAKLLEDPSTKKCKVANKVAKKNKSLGLQNVQEPAATPPKKRKNKNVDSTVRRSQRLRTTIQPCANEAVERLIQEITISESENEDEMVLVEKEEKVDEAELIYSVEEDENEEKEDHVVDAVKEINFKPSEDDFICKIPLNEHAKYKSMYIHNQKKVKSLTEKNSELSLKLDKAQEELKGSTKTNLDLTRKLDNALGKLEVYEKFMGTVFVPRAEATDIGASFHAYAALAHQENDHEVRSVKTATTRKSRKNNQA